MKQNSTVPPLRMAMIREDGETKTVVPLGDVLYLAAEFVTYQDLHSFFREYGRKMVVVPSSIQEFAQEAYKAGLSVLSASEDPSFVVRTLNPKTQAEVESCRYAKIGRLYVAYLLLN